MASSDTDYLGDAKSETGLEHDDFTRIRGISQKTAHRLYESGVLTYAKLATLSPSDIIARLGAGSGVSAETIAEKDWAGQAAALAAGPDAIAGAREKSSESGPHVVSYVLQLLLDEHNCIRQTTIHHTQSGEEEVWEEWNEKQLLSFFARRPELSLPQVEHATSVKVSFK